MCGEDTPESCEGSGGSLMPCHPDPSLDGITRNWIVFHLLWEQPGWDPPSLPRFLRIPAAIVILPPKPVHPVHIPLHRRCTEPPAFTCHGKFPLAMQKHKELNKASDCTIPAAAAAAAATEPRQRAVYHPNGGSNMLRSCVVMLNFCCTNLSFLPQKFCEERWMKGRFGNGDWGEQKVRHDKYINMC